MKILILTSGGDAPGMNMIIYQLRKAFKKNLFYCEDGFKGLINGNIYNINDLNLQNDFQFKAGSVIGSSRCPEFQTETGFKEGLSYAKQFDYVVVLGGNGSYKGCKQLTENNVKTIFVPSTIDNDVDISDYSQGFDTAVSSCKFYIENTMPTINTFKRCCIYEVMGRKCGKIATETFKSCKCDYLISYEKDLKYNKITKIINDNFSKRKGSSIILRENIIEKEDILDTLQKKCPNVEIKYSVIGYLQRGFIPTKKELKIAKLFAKNIVKLINIKSKSKALVIKKNILEVID